MQSSNMLFALLSLLFLIPGVHCHEDYQTIPLRYDAALNYLQRYQHSSLNELLDDASKYRMMSDVSFLNTSFLADNATTPCERDFVILLEDLFKREMWAVKTIDAWGKPLPSGILKGNVYWLGSYDECLQPVYTPGNKTFVSQPISTQHCTVTPSSTGSQQTFGASGLVFGLCIPSTCDQQDVVSLIHALFKNSTTKAENVICSSDPPNGHKGLTVGAIVTITLLSLMGLLVLVGTVVDLITIPKHDSIEKGRSNINGHNHLTDLGLDEPHLLDAPRYSLRGWIDTTPRTVFLAEFSALKTLRRIFTMKQKKDNETYLFLDGIRVLSLFWVIIGHSFLFGLVFTSNALDAVIWTRNFSLQLIISAPFSVDTFFLLSGFLTTVMFVRHVEKKGKLSFRLMALYYIHRYLRLTPTFLFVILISINLTPYFGTGPMYPSQQGFEVPQCRSQYWWTSILYVGNIVKPDYMCLPVSWYLYNDMQFHWIAPLSLVPFVLGRKPIAFIMCILLILVGIGSTAGLLIYYPNLKGMITEGPTTTGGMTYFNTVYVTPWCRVSAYFVGVLTGFFVLNTPRSYRLNRYVSIIFSTLAVVLALVCLFIFYPDSILPNGLDRTSFVFYQALSRTLWCLAIGWLIFSCVSNRDSLVAKILSWPIWAPLSRLNYSTYLTHITVIFIIVINQRMPFYYQPHLVVNNFVCHIFFSYVTAIVVVMFIETPFFLLEKHLFQR